MIVKINSPVLVPFAYDLDVLKKLIEMDKEIYIASQYGFWSDFIELIAKGLPSKFTIDYIRQKIDNDFTGIVRKSKYYNLFSNLFNSTTANTIDRLYQIELDYNQKKILCFLLCRVLELNMDDKEGLKKPIITKEKIDYYLKNIDKYIPRLNLRNINIKFIKEELTNQKFASVFDNVYRKSRLYTPQYLGFISVFTNKKEKLLSWDDRLKHVISDNLIHGGNIILFYPSEYEERINTIMKKNKFKKIHKNVWQKPDLKLKKIKKGIKRYF